ncbi:MAG TPA: hypothetical protein DIW64_07770 [Cellvibrio sp.]|nr:hypothetical protein [Cellvibrio sp.]
MLPYIVHDEKPVWLFQPDLVRYDDNVFSVVVGKNGVGKSRLLRNIADEMMNSNESIYEAKRVVAISTSPFDKFKTEIKSEKWLFTNPAEYYYVGMKNGIGLSRSPSVSLISSATSGILDNFISENKNINLAKVFEVLGFHPEATIALKFSGKRNYANEGRLKIFDYEKIPVSHDSYGIYYEDNQNSILNLIEKFSHAGVHISNRSLEKMKVQSRDELENIGYCFYKAREYFSSDKLFSINLNFNEGIATLPRHSEFESNFSDFFHRIGGEQRYVLQKHEGFSREILKSISVLIKYEIVQINDIKLRKMATDTMSLRRASSGEQCMMVIMLGVAGHISDNSCILIDEPEISFHPEWQEKFISLLIDAFSSYRRCHFIIATHSPQIVSNLDRENCFVTSLSSGKIRHSEFFSNRSSDFQLAEIFESPGNRNEYILRRAMGLMANIRLNKSLDGIDKKEYNQLMQFTKNMERDDPIIKIIESVREAASFYENK